MNKDTSNETAWTITGGAVMALLAMVILHVPAWILLALFIVGALIVSGGDLETYSQQLDRRKHEEVERYNQAQEAKQSDLQLDVPKEERAINAYRKTEFLQLDSERMELLKDLQTIGIDIKGYEVMSKQQIEDSLSTEDKILLREMRGFLL